MHRNGMLMVPGAQWSGQRCLCLGMGMGVEERGGIGSERGTERKRSIGKKEEGIGCLLEGGRKGKDKQRERGKLGKRREGREELRKRREGRGSWGRERREETAEEEEKGR